MRPAGSACGAPIITSLKPSPFTSPPYSVTSPNLTTLPTVEERFVVLIAQRTPERIRPLSEVRADVEAAVLAQERQDLQRAWLTGLRGVSHLVTRRFFHLDSTDGLLDDETSAILLRQDGSVVLGHENGLTFLEEKPRQVTLGDRGTDIARIMDMHEDADGVLLSGQERARESAGEGHRGAEIAVDRIDDGVSAELRGAAQRVAVALPEAPQVGPEPDGTPWLAALGGRGGTATGNSAALLAGNHLAHVPPFFDRSCLLL